jgi:hypothetical protein
MVNWQCGHRLYTMGVDNVAQYVLNMYKNVSRIFLLDQLLKLKILINIRYQNSM